MLSQATRLELWLLLTANALLPISILIFAVGFFPHKPFLPGINALPNVGAHGERSAPFDKIIFMVVDALRSDFVYSENSGFSFVQGLVRSGAAIPFTAHATSPTITMPRVKAMTTGSIPSFLDVILNFAESDTTSTLANQDTWPLQLSLQRAGRLAFYGDDTWLKLFPNLFSRSDGTTSFFVSDFTEVDNNVTRHIDAEMQKSDWNGIIMHYLGLDHIGHKTGPNGPNMQPKQREMDAIIHKMYGAMNSAPHLQSTLLIVCGDHGMNDAGNHGGSSPGETSPALVFISPKLQAISRGVPCPHPVPDEEFQYYNTVEQSDIVPTLAGLLGFAIPLNNLGVFIPKFLEFWPPADRQSLLRANAEQVLGVLGHAYGNIHFDEDPPEDLCRLPKSDGELLHCTWFAANASLKDEGTSQPSEPVLKFLQIAQKTLSSAASNYDMSKLWVGVALATLSTLSAFCSLLVRWAQSSSGSMSTGCSTWLLFLATSHGIMMFASSYVEEEHQYWHWLSSAWLTWLFFTRYNQQGYSFPFFIGLAAVLGRIVRRWNQTGQKHAGDPDIAKNFLSSHQHFLWILVLCTYFYVGAKLADPNLNGRFNLLVPLILATVLAALEFKIAFTYADAPELLSDISLPTWIWETIARVSLITQARLAFLGLLGCFLLGMLKLFGEAPATRRLLVNRYFTSLASLFLLTQTRVTNIPLILLFSGLLEILERLDVSIDELAISLIVFQHLSFFAYGGSNAISSMDLSNAYNGVDSYNVIAVGILTFVSNWAGPIWWSTNLFGHLVSKTGDAWVQFRRLFQVLTLFAATSVLAVMVACTLLRAHLFIWTVFSPKYLFSMAWSLGHHMIANGLLGALILQIAN